MSEPQIICPNCSYEIKLTESLAAPLIEATRKRFSEQLIAKDAEVARKEEALRMQQDEIARTRESIADQISARLQAERSQIVAAETKKARTAAAAEMETKSKELAELQHVLKENNQKLAAAQQAQADLMRKERELDAAKRELELTVEQRVRTSLAEVQNKAKQESEDMLKAQLSQKDLQMAAMNRTIEELRRKMEQGSQQTQGEALELELEELLRSKFPVDLIQPVGKGEFGGDIVQRVNGSLGQAAGDPLGIQTHQELERRLAGQAQGRPARRKGRCSPDHFADVTEGYRDL